MTEDHKKIIQLMKAKKELTWKTYFIKADEEAIMKWSAKVAKDVWESIYKARNRSHSLDIDSCPFCIKHDSNCNYCAYAKNHNGQCRENRSSFNRNMKKNTDKVDQLTNAWYESTIDAINDPRTDEEIKKAKEQVRANDIVSLKTTLNTIIGNVESIKDILSRLEI